MHQDLEHFKRQLNEQKEQRLQKIQQDYMEQIKLKQAEFETLKHQNTVKNDQNKQILVKSLNQKLSNEKEKLQINTQEKLREVAV